MILVLLVELVGERALCVMRPVSNRGLEVSKRLDRLQVNKNLSILWILRLLCAALPRIEFGTLIWTCEASSPCAFLNAARSSSMPRPHSANRAEPAKTSLANSVRPSALTTTPSVVSFIWMLEVIVACFVLLFFYAFVQYSTWPKGCLRAGRSREWLLASRFGRFVSGSRGAHLLQAAFENSSLFCGLL